MTYENKCPCCGTINKGLNLDETDGWYICEKCHFELQVLGHQQMCKIPVYTGKQLAALVKSQLSR